MDPSSSDIFTLGLNSRVSRLVCPLSTLTRVVFQNKLGDTALHAAAWKGHSDIVEMLLKKSEWQNSEGNLQRGFLHKRLTYVARTFASDPRTDLRNNENKLAVDMATNARCASLLKRAQEGSKYSRH